jgi:hypothetical protein
VQFEPFNLKAERERGYFDDDGNYVEHKTDPTEERDAWLDSEEAKVVSAQVAMHTDARTLAWFHGSEYSQKLLRRLAAQLPGSTCLERTGKGCAGWHLGHHTHGMLAACCLKFVTSHCCRPKAAEVCAYALPNARAALLGLRAVVTSTQGRSHRATG